MKKPMHINRTIVGIWTNLARKDIPWYLQVMFSFLVMLMACIIVGSIVGPHFGVGTLGPNGVERMIELRLQSWQSNLLFVEDLSR